MFARIMRWSKSRGWNQSDLASELGLAPQNVSNWKYRDVPPEKYADIARLFGRSVDELLGIVDEKTGATLSPSQSWPFDMVDERKVRDLDAKPRAQLEAAILIAAAQVGLDVKKEG